MGSFWILYLIDGMTIMSSIVVVHIQNYLYKKNLEDKLNLRFYLIMFILYCYGAIFYTTIFQKHLLYIGHCFFFDN